MKSIRCSVFQTPTPSSFEHLDDVVITHSNGEITAITPADEWVGEVDESLDVGKVLIPGLIDLHIHAPQWAQLGTGYDVPLDEWLFEYTFPTEAKCADIAYAIDLWNNMVPALLANGTTTAVYYGSVHVPATTALAKACVQHGQRAWVGRTAMDHPEGTPEYYRDATAAEGLLSTRTSIEQIVALEDSRGLVQPIITPRFIPACTDELLVSLGELAEETGHLVQTHCSENDWEHGYVLERHSMSDTDSLDRFGLLRDHTVLAHGTLLRDVDFDTIAERGAGVAHCPLSNVYFGDAVFPTRRAMQRGVRVGLGTDIAGGPSASLLANTARAIDVSRHLENGVDQRVRGVDRGVADSRIDSVTAFYLATLGGAEVLGAPIGLLEVGRRFDAVAISLDNISVEAESEPAQQSFEKLIRLAGRADISTVWVDGEKVVDVAQPEISSE